MHATGVEAFRLPSMDPVELAATVQASITGDEQVDSAVDSGRGAILALPHGGFQDLAGVFAVQRWGTFATVASG